MPESTTATITVPATTTTIPEGGGETGGYVTGPTGPGGGGYSSLEPIVNTTARGFEIINLSQLNRAVIELNEKVFNITENYITPDYAGITINNANYVIYPNQTIQFDSTAIDNYYLKMTNLTFIPIRDTVSFELYYGPNETAGALFVPTENSTINLTLLNPRDVQIDLFGMSTLLTLIPNEPGNFTLYVKNLTSSSNLPPVPESYSMDLAVNIDVNSRTPGNSDSLVMSTASDCPPYGNTTVPFMLVNGTWKRLDVYTLYPSSCITSFSINNNATVALMDYLAPLQNATTTTVPSENATQGGEELHAPNAGIVVVSMLVVGALIVAAIAISRKARSARR